MNPSPPVFSLAQTRQQQWQSLLNSLAKKQLSQAEYQLAELANTERFWAFPGILIIQGLEKYIAQEKFQQAYNLADNAFQAINRPRTKHFSPFSTPLDELDKLQLEVERPANKRQKPCFDILIVHPNPEQYFYSYYQQLMGQQTEQDEMLYDLYFVKNLADAITALVNNPNIQATVCLENCHVQSDLAFANQTYQTFQEELNAKQTAQEFLTLAKTIRPDIQYIYISEKPFAELLPSYFNDFHRVVFHEAPFKDIHYTSLQGLKERLHSPFYDALHAYSQKPKGVFHALPIARGSSLKNSRWVKDFYDFYGQNIFDAETSSTQGGLDSLLNPKGAIKGAQYKAEQAFGSKRTYFVTNGTSTSNKIVMQANLKPGDIVFISSDCHKSVPYGVILTGANVFFMQTNSVEKYDLYGAVPLQQILDQMLILKAEGKLSRLKQIVLTNSTFDGLIYDVETYMMAILAIKPDIIFHWDEAWYAHAHFNPLYQRRHAMFVTAKLRKRFASQSYQQAYDSAEDKTGLPDPGLVKLRVYATQSTHKTLSSFRQGSMIHVDDDLFNEDRYLEAYYTHTSTSPNYQILASLDIARRQMAIEGYALTLKSFELATWCRHEFSQTSEIANWFRVLGAQDIFPETTAIVPPELDFKYLSLLKQHQAEGMLLDPTRLTLDIRKTGLTGNQFRKLLIDKYDIQVNKTSRHTVLFIINIGATEQTVQYLKKVLLDIAEKLQHTPLKLSKKTFSPMPQNRCYTSCYQAFPETTSLSQFGNIRHAYYDAFEDDNIDYLTLSSAILEEAKQGKTWISASFVTPYPPGFPLFVPGQIIDYKGLLYFADIMNDEIHGFHIEKGLKIFTSASVALT